MVTNKNSHFSGTGRRKTASARVILRSGSGNISVNNKKAEDYFSTEASRKTLVGPLKTVDMIEKFDITVLVQGGGVSSQADAVAMGMARALEKMNPDLRALLKPEGHLRRDPRKKERKKSGQPGARKKFQFSKR